LAVRVRVELVIDPVVLGQEIVPALAEPERDPVLAEVVLQVVATVPAAELVLAIVPEELPVPVIDRAAELVLAIALAVVRELETVRAEAERELAPVAAELELVQVVAELELVRAAVALRTKSVTAPHRPDLAPLLEAAVDLVAVAETMREPAATEAVIAWEVADIVAVAAAAAVTEPAAVAEDAAVVAEDAAVAAEDAEDKGGVNEEETNENKNKYYDFAENFSGRFCDPYFLFVNDRSARCAIGQDGCACDIAANPKRIRHAETGC
jgi:hypothetical protein